MIKILFLIPNLGHGGAEKVLVNLVNYMDKSRFDITVMALYDGGINKKFLSSDVQYRSCFKKSFRGISHVLKLGTPSFLYSMFIKQHYDVIVSYLEGQTARIVSGCNDKKTKLVSWIHVEQHTLQCAAHAFRSINEMTRCYYKFNKTICVSEYVKKDFQSLIPIKNVEVLYNTVESEKIRNLANENVPSDLFDKNEIKLCGIGTLKKSKGFDRLLKIHKKLRENGYPIHTYILGEGDERKLLEEYIKVQHLEGTVSFLGYKINPYKYLSKCDLFVCTSFAEGFSTAASESLIVGTPVCTVEVSGMKEMLGEHNEYGIVTANEDEAFYNGVKNLLDNKNLLEHYKRQAVIRGKVFDTKSTVKATENMFLELIGENND
ncbi:glycosyltransferase [Anaerostipes faecalis]|uniref:glycosyltransferase n=1 Tax=Anaerostipes faecalis TaxID=2738446 RepID=UPI003EFE4584